MKKDKMHNARLAIMVYGAASAIVSTVVPTEVNAASTACTTQGTASSPLYCTIASGAGVPLASSVNFTGSTNVSAFYDTNTTNVAICASHAQGTSSYGFTLDGKSKINTTTGSAASLTAGCA